MRNLHDSPSTWLLCVAMFFSMVIVSAAVPASAQEPAATASAFAPFSRADFAVPDAPAFKVLDVQPSDIMRPATVREVGVAIANFLEGGALLPKAFAAELSPGLLLGGSDLPLQKYRDNRILYRTRVSIGSKSQPDGTTELALGVRCTLLDESDLRTDRAFGDSLLVLVTEINNAWDSCQRQVVDSALGGMEKYAELEDGDPVKTKIDAAINARAAVRRTALDASIIGAREHFRELNWNKSIIDLGFAMAGLTPDSLATHLNASQYALWVTGGFPLGEEGQLLVGLHGSVTKDDAGEFKRGQGSFTLRGYYGSNLMKGFLEGSGQGSDELPATYDLSAGAELRMTDGLWIDFAIGLAKRVAEEARISTSLNVRFATPELHPK